MNAQHQLVIRKGLPFAIYHYFYWQLVTHYRDVVPITLRQLCDMFGCSYNQTRWSFWYLRDKDFLEVDKTEHAGLCVFVVTLGSNAPQIAFESDSEAVA